MQSHVHRALFHYNLTIPILKVEDLRLLASLSTRTYAAWVPSMTLDNAFHFLDRSQYIWTINHNASVQSLYSFSAILPTHTRVTQLTPDLKSLL